MIVTEKVTNIRTGEVTEREIELPDLLTEAEGIAKDARDAQEAANAAIRAQLAANDLRALRAIVEGDTARIEAHKVAQAALRAQMA